MRRSFVKEGETPLSNQRLSLSRGSGTDVVATIPKKRRPDSSQLLSGGSDIAQRGDERSQKYLGDSIEQTNDHLRRRVFELEEQSKRQSEVNETLHGRVKIAEGELAKTRSQVLRVGDVAGWKSGQVSELNGRYHELAQGHNQLLDNVRSHSHTVSLQLQQKDEEIARLRTIIDERTDKLKVVAVTQERNFDKCISLDRELVNTRAELSLLREQLANKSHELDISKLSHKAEGAFIVEVQHLKADVQRLLLMLKNTDEFKEFAEIADDSSQSIRFLKDVRARSYVDNNCHSKCRVLRPCMCASNEFGYVEDEKLLWVPEESYKFAQSFRLKYNGELTDTLVENLLFELNKIWARREARLLQRLKGNAAHETAGLRRQLAFNPKYDEQQAKATIARLQQQLKQAYKENRDAFAQRERRNPVGTAYVSETLKQTREKTRVAKRADDKLKVLQNKVASMEENQFQNTTEKALFMEGASWMSKQILQETSYLQEAITTHVKSLHEKQESLMQNHEHSASITTASTLDPSVIIRKCEWFVENIDSEVSGFKSKLQHMQRQAEKDMIQANIKLNPQANTSVISTF